MTVPSKMKPKTILTCGIGLSLLLGLAALLGLLIPRRGAGNAGATCQYSVCVARFGYHSMLILPAANALFKGVSEFGLADSTAAQGSSGSGSTPSQADPNLPSEPAQYLGVGWGEKFWYVNPPTEDAQLLQGLRALLLPNAAVIKIQPYQRFPSHYETICLGVTAEHFTRLISFIRDTFQRNAQNQPIYVAADPKHNAKFYAAKGTYWLSNNSNHWVATGLRLVGADTPLWPAHAAAIMRIVQPTCPSPTAQWHVPILDLPNLLALRSQSCTDWSPDALEATQEPSP